MGHMEIHHVFDRATTVWSVDRPQSTGTYPEQPSPRWDIKPKATVIMYENHGI